MKAVVLKDGEGTVMSRPMTKGSVTVKVAGETSTMFEIHRRAGDARGPGLHSHPGFDESFYVLSGEWEFVAGDQMIIAEAGTVVHLPRGIFHGFRSTGRVDGKLLGVAVPGGIEDSFEEAARTAEDATAGRLRGTASHPTATMLPEYLPPHGERPGR